MVCKLILPLCSLMLLSSSVIAENRQFPELEKTPVFQEEIPLLDMAELRSSDQEKFIQELGDGLHKTGFVLIKNHGISPEKIDAAKESTKAFFSLPLETKRKYQGKALNRGYKSYSPEREDKKADLQEYWHVGPLESAPFDVPEIQDNLWPSEIDSFQNDLSLLYQEIFEKTQPILTACSLYMGKESAYLHDLTNYGDSVMRVIHYLPNQDGKSETVWKAPHRDPNLLTVISGISMAGLEVETADGRWIPVPYHPDAIVVSVSNMLESVSNGIFRSARHRVVIHNSNASRFAIPFFYHVERDLSIAPQPECLAKTGGTPHHPDQTAEEALKGHNWFTPTKAV